jgi:hypothetical protein
LEAINLLTNVVATEFVRRVTNGRTQPLILTCERVDGSTVEVVSKFSAGCEEGVTHLAREAIGSCLAADLGLPIPEAFLVEIPPDLADAIPDAVVGAKIKGSSPRAFGCKLITGGFSGWGSSSKISATMLPIAAAIFVFDAIIQNPDRRGINPNCLVRGDELRIFDHELAFAHRLVIGWRAPWLAGGLNSLETPGNHIFREGLRQQVIDFGAIRAAWTGLSNDRISAYEGVCPAEWAEADAAISAIVSLIRDARDNIDGCLTEIQRVMQ